MPALSDGQYSVAGQRDSFSEIETVFVTGWYGTLSGKNPQQ